MIYAITRCDFIVLLGCTACNDVDICLKNVEDSQLGFRTITSIRDVPTLVDKFLSASPKNSDCWIVFDVDYTLTMPTLIHENKNYVVTKESLSKAVADVKDNESFDRAISATLFFPQVLIDKTTPAILDNLRQKGRVFALTAAVGSEKHKQVRSKTLNTMGVDFSKSFSPSEISLDDIKTYAGQCPSFSEGILYANGEMDPANNKGRVLVSFIEKIKKTPSCIIVIDDRKKNLEDIKKSLTNIKFLGILYKNLSKYNDAPVEIVKKRISKVLTEKDL